MLLNLLFLLSFSFTLVSCTTPHTIYWAERIDEETYRDSWITWDTYFRKKVKPIVDEGRFKQAIKQGHLIFMSISEIKGLPIENAGFQRLAAKTAEEAYPENDRPRGDVDIESVKYHLQTKNKVSPITIARVTDLQGRQRLIKLDGVHRLVAASILQSSVAVLWIDFDHIS
jgi:hypothetical protein